MKQFLLILSGLLIFAGMPTFTAAQAGCAAQPRTETATHYISGTTCKLEMKININCTCEECRGNFTGEFSEGNLPETVGMTCTRKGPSGFAFGVGYTGDQYECTWSVNGNSATKTFDWFRLGRTTTQSACSTLTGWVRDSVQ